MTLFHPLLTIETACGLASGSAEGNTLAFLEFGMNDARLNPEMAVEMLGRRDFGLSRSQ